jgi:type I restriction enzyme S subunit
MAAGHVRNEDILVVKDGATTGKVALVDSDSGLTEAAVNEHVFRLEIDEAAAVPKYVFRFLQSPSGRSQILSDFRGATVGGISRGFVERVRLPLPPLVEQRRVAAILDKADAIRRRRRDGLPLLDEFLRSAFLEMFGDPVRNERAWEILRLDDLAEIMSGVTMGRKLPASQARQVPYLRVANVQDGRVDVADLKTTPATPEEIHKCRLRTGDIVLTEGGDRDKLGRGAVWHGEIPECIHQNHIFRVRVDGRFSPEYVSALLGSAYGKRYFLKAAKQTTGIASINRTQLGRFPVPAAPLALQRRYEAAVRQTLALELRLKTAAAATAELAESLAEQVFALRSGHV